MTNIAQIEASAYHSQFYETLEALPKSLSDLLTTYSRIPKDHQIDHVVKLRDEAYADFPYPCIGTFRFLEFDLSAHYAYQEHVLSPLKMPFPDNTIEPLFLDLGTCFGQDFRKLVHDGALVRRLWASDIDSKFIDFGFKMFNDADKLPMDHFLCPGNLISKSPDDKLHVLDDKVTILHLTAVFHLFSLEDQKAVADRCLQLLRKDTGGPVLVLGAHVGSLSPGPYQRQNVSQDYSHKYRHDEESWKGLWDYVRGKDAWKNKIKNLEVKSRLLRRNKVKDAESGEITVFTRPDPGSNLLWQMYEVWVTFT
ncbi:uncharacterized protein GGS22DRAFT_169257 [Annulohypoxylon maeteangense]|uniref:uncharacterized protein n=1 Tax=Annulohypoxylon maeteangense TaxID=1927788 RepID=UPI00200734AC|nr:uncharacterized protein GGS22DRAFT_169257 [Annulohypoxylon maeteangense]KAI0883002.1 hypothetical protein GGS22DRAFT_169257 [Annulohypoxylon maeteangense]